MEKNTKIAFAIVASVIAAYFIVIAVNKKKSTDKDSAPEDETVPSGSGSENNPSTTKYATVILGVNVRTSPSTSSSVVRIAYAGEQFRVLGQQGTWYKVDEGWITSKPEFVDTEIV